MRSYESTLQCALKYASMAIITCVVATGGLWIANLTSLKRARSFNALSPAHWMFWVTGRDLEVELRNPTPVIDLGTPVIPAWDSEQIGNFARYLKEEQEKRDQLMEEIRVRWGTPTK